MSEKILIIEDDDLYCELVGRVLVKEGFVVRCTNRLQEGIKLAKQDPPDAIVLDLGLPDSSADKTVESMKQVINTAIIVVLSGNTEAAKNCIMQSASGYLNKDDGLKYLGREIRNAIHTHSKIQRIDSAISGLSN